MIIIDRNIFHPIYRFICNNCRNAKGLGKRKENRFNAASLPQTKLGAHIEGRVNNFLKSQESDEAGFVHIRIVSSVDKTMDVRPGMRKRYVNLIMLHCVNNNFTTADSGNFGNLHDWFGRSKSDVYRFFLIFKYINFEI